MVKPYVLFPMVIAIAVWTFVSRQRAAHRRIELRVGPMLLAITLAVVGLLALGSLFPAFSLEHIAEQAQQQQMAWDRPADSSAVEIGAGQSSFASQIPFVPLALANSLFRPFLFEARNITMLAASIETTVLTFLVVRMFWQTRYSVVRDAILTSPLMAASVTFVFVFGIAVGLTTLNLGSLSRYRLPMVPYYVIFVSVLSRRMSSRSERDTRTRDDARP
jgi:heme A synthase